MARSQAPREEFAVARLAAAYLSAHSARRVGAAAQVVAAVGLVAWAVVTYLYWSGLAGVPWRERLAQSLSAVTILLAAGLIGAVGTALRLAADWVDLRLPSLASDGDDDGPESADPYGP